MSARLPAGWKTIILGEHAEFRNGVNFTTKSNGKTVKVLGVSDFASRSVIDDFSQMPSVTLANDPKDDDYLRDGDFVFVRSNGSKDLIGRCAMVFPLTERVMFSGFTIRMRLSSKQMIPRFWLTIAKSELFKKALHEHGSGSYITNLSQETLSEIEVALPNLEEQLRIVAVLDAWDQAIDQTERLIDAKRRQKTGMLVRVFGTERNPLKTKGTPLGDIATIHYGKGLSPTDYSSEGQSPVFGTQGEIGRTNRRLFEGPAIIVGRKGTLDKPVLVDTPRPFWAIDTVFVVKPRTDARLLHAFLDFIDLKNLNEASGVPSISSDNLGALLIPSAATEKAEKFEPIIVAIQKNIEDAENRLDQLVIQKRGLMQKLLTGEWQLDGRFDRLVPHTVGGQS